jgi:hypothetical protein
MDPTHPSNPRDPTVTQLIFLESGGFAGLQRGCTVEPSSLPEVPRTELQSLLQQTPSAQVGASHAAPAMPDMQTYTLELVMKPPGQEASAPGAGHQHRVLTYPASDVPSDLSELIGFLREQARPIEPR